MLLSGLGGVLRPPRNAISKRLFASFALYSSLGGDMIKTPYSFEAILSDQEFQKIGQFACRWALIEHTLANCLRVILEMEPEQATVMIFPLNLDTRMKKMEELSKLNLLTDYQKSLLAELKPLIISMQYIRNTVLHGIVVSFTNEDNAYFHLRSKLRNLTKDELFSCDDLINYTAHVTQAFRVSFGDKEYPGHTYALPDRPPIPSFLPKECQARLPTDMEARLTRQAT